MNRSYRLRRHKRTMKMARWTSLRCRTSRKLNLRVAGNYGFRGIGFFGKDHLDHSLLCFVLRYEPRLRIDFKGAAATRMTHQLLDDLHVLSISDE